MRFSSRFHRRLGALAAACGLAFLALAIQPASAAEDVDVFADSLASGWQNWSWDTTSNFASASPTHAGGAAIAVTHTNAWAGLYLRGGEALLQTDYETIQFYIHGGASGGQQLSFFAFDDAGGASPQSISLPPLEPSWTLVEVPVASLGSFGTIGGLCWQDRVGSAHPTYHLDDIRLVASDAPPPPGPSLAVDSAADRRAISPYIYGLNFADEELIEELGVPVRRWGGNATTRYSWIHDVNNRASDWFFENIANDNPNPGALPFGSASDQFVSFNKSVGTETLLTIPIIGWAPKSRAYTYGFSVAKYGAQQQLNPFNSDSGNGVRTNGTEIAGNDPTDTSVAIDPTYVTDWMAHLAGQFGTAANGGVRFYNLDNEPMLWNSTHRDVHPNGAGYDEMRDRTIAYAAALKAADPAALTVGPALWGWSAYFYSAKDIQDGGAQWWNTRPDRIAHGDVPFAPWYLARMKEHDDANGVRLLDYFDLHYYPQASGVALSGAGDAATQARRLRSVRSLWDASYVDESWIGEPVRLIPRMREWVDANYPGTKLAMTEYNWGGLEHINGALAQADVLGVFGREGLDLATHWAPPTSDQPGAFAFRMFLNYDGAGAKFGDTHVASTTADFAQLGVHAAERSSDGALTILVINKTNGALDAPLSLANFAHGATAETWRYSEANLGAIVRLADAAISGEGAIAGAFPARSLTLFVVATSGEPNAGGDGVKVY